MALQRANLPARLTEQEARREGFVTVEHDLDLLTRMNTPHPHIVARAAGEIIGYALVMGREMAKSIPVLLDMFEQINAIVYRGNRLGQSRYVVMGQICIAKAWRGKGVFAGLYEAMARRLSGHFDYIITEIALRNTRSMRAHEKAGFEKVLEYRGATGEDWTIVLLDISGRKA